MMPLRAPGFRLGASAVWRAWLDDRFRREGVLGRVPDACPLPTPLQSTRYRDNLMSSRPADQLRPWN